MTNEDVRSELERWPFSPVRLYLVSGKEFDVMMPGVAFMLRNAVMILQQRRSPRNPGYDIIALRNIERLERLEEQE